MDTYYEGATSDYSAWTRKDNESSFLVPMEETFLDPRFWQAIGPAVLRCGRFCFTIHQQFSR